MFENDLKFFLYGKSFRKIRGSWSVSLTVSYKGRRVRERYKSSFVIRARPLSG